MKTETPKECRPPWLTSCTVTGNWRLIFLYDEEAKTAGEFDLLDFH